MEINHYNTRKLVIRDADSASLRIGGFFPAIESEIFARSLLSIYGVAVYRLEPSGEIVIGRPLR